MVGSEFDDVIAALGGSDIIVAGGGNDIICGGAGHDWIDGGPGHDMVAGGRGEDVLLGAGGADTLRSGPGDDRLSGGTGNDLLFGGPGWDHLDLGGGETVEPNRRSGCADRSAAEYCSDLADSTLVSVPGRGPLLGSAGAVRTFSVEVESRTRLDPNDVIAVVQRILGDRRGWTASGLRRFQRTVPTDAAIRVLIATPATVDRMCAPLRTNGWLSCRRGDTVILNVDRWNGAIDHWTAPLAEYRAYLVNHEIGHLLGLGHADCPGTGQPAPVMQQQTKSLQGCRPNGWPSP